MSQNKRAMLGLLLVGTCSLHGMALESVDFEQTTLPEKKVEVQNLPDCDDLTLKIRPRMCLVERRH